MAFFAYGICLHIEKKKKTPSIPCVWHPKPKNKCQIPRRNLWETETRSPVTCGTCRIIQVCLSLRLIELPLPIWDTFVECLPLGPPPRIWNLAFMRVIYVNLLFLYLFSFRHFFWRVFFGVSSARVRCQNIAQAAGKRGLKSELNQLIMKMQMFSSAPAASFFRGQSNE